MAPSFRIAFELDLLRKAENSEFDVIALGKGIDWLCTIISSACETEVGFRGCLSQIHPYYSPVSTHGEWYIKLHTSILPGLHRYRDAPEPDIIGHSMTCRATAEDIQKLHDDGDATWTPALAELIRV